MLSIAIIPALLRWHIKNCENIAISWSGRAYWSALWIASQEVHISTLVGSKIKIATRLSLLKFNQAISVFLFRVGQKVTACDIEKSKLTLKTKVS